MGLPDLEQAWREATAMPCGCVDYHMADCPTVAPPSDDRPDPDGSDWRYPDEDWTSEVLGA